MSKHTRGPNVWVTRTAKGWIVKTERGQQPPHIGATQNAAIHYGRSLARAYGSELIVQGRNARIRIKDSHGRDPFPPKG